MITVTSQLTTHAHTISTCNAMVGETRLLVKKPNCKSVVWTYFGLEADDMGIPLRDKEDSPICKTCKKAVLAKGGNTSNLLTHLRDHHPDLYSEVTSSNSQAAKRQPTLQEVVDKSKGYNPKSSRAQELYRAVAYCIAKDMHPLCTVERPGFQHLVSKLDPRYVLPSRKYFTQQEIPRLYCEVRDNVVLKKLKEAKYFAATTDLWTSCANHPYLSYTIHFITNNWSLQSFCLDTVPLFEDHTGQNIIEAIQDVSTNWNLSTEYLVATTTDNGSNFIAGMNSAGCLRISCFGHNLDLAINKALNVSSIQQAIRKCHTLIELFNRSWKKKQRPPAEAVRIGNCTAQTNF